MSLLYEFAIHGCSISPFCVFSLIFLSAFCNFHTCFVNFIPNISFPLALIVDGTIFLILVYTNSLLVYINAIDFYVLIVSCDLAEHAYKF